MLAVVVGTAGADTRSPPSPRCCEAAPGWAVGVETGAVWAKTEEIVEARPEHAAEHLSYLTWEARAVVAGVDLRYRTPGILRMNGRLWHLGDAGAGKLTNLDYLGGAASVLSWADDRDTHVLRDTEYYNTYRRGRYLRPEIAVGMGLAGRLAVEAFFETALQLGFAEGRTRIKTPRGVYVADEKPDYRMTLHRVGIRLVWPVFPT